MSKLKYREFWIYPDHTGTLTVFGKPLPNEFVLKAHVIEKAPVDKLLDEVESTIQRRLKSDEACGRPFDEDLGGLLNKLKEFRSNEW